MKYQMAKLTSKGQLTLPKSVREQFKLDKGSYLQIYLENNQIVMKKVNLAIPLGDADPIWDMVGVFHDSEGAVNLSTDHVRYVAFGEAVRWKQSL